MKIGELITGLRHMMPNEQLELVRLIKKEGALQRHTLSDRQQHLAETMTKSGVLDRIYNEETETIIYKLPVR